MLDVQCLEFSNGVLAASALFHFSSLELVENVSGKKMSLKVVFFFFFFPLALITSSFCPCSPEESGRRAVREVDGAVRDGAARNRRVAHENVHGNPCR